MATCMSCGWDQNRTGARHCGQCGARLSFLAPGETLDGGRYRIIKVLGKGGMGAVCLVEDTKLYGRHWVVKELIDYFNPADPVEVQKAEQRFHEEARTLAGLDHPSIPIIKEHFTEAGRNYIVMEYVEGENLQQRLLREGKALPTELVLNIGIQMCRVLEYLAGRNPPLVHHDIKPANIIMNEEAAAATLVDFGTAKVRFVSAGGLGQGQSSVYGTVGYAPPEQYGQPGQPPQTEPRSDVYALAATLYQLATNDDPGGHPFSFPLLHTLPAGLRKSLESALDSDVRRRPTAAQLRAAFEAVRDGPRTGQPYTFPNGDKARTAEELALLCDKNWNVARDLLWSNSFEPWLRTNLFRSDLAAEATQLSHQADRDLALEAFIQALAPGADKPLPRFAPATISLGTIKADRYLTQTVQITNGGRRGHLAGTIEISPPVGWMSVDKQAFSGNNTAVQVTVSTAGLAQGARLSADIVVHPPSSPSVTLPVRGRIEVAWLGFLGMVGLYVLLGALLGAGLSWLIGQGRDQLWSGNLRYYWIAGVVLLGVAFAVALAKAARQPNDGIAAGKVLIGGVFALFIAAYLLAALQFQFGSVAQVHGDQAAHLVIAGVIILPALLLGLWGGLRKLRRMALAILIPLLILSGVCYWIIKTQPMVLVSRTNTPLFGPSVPVFYAALYGMESTTTVLPEILPTAIRPLLQPTFTSTPRVTPTVRVSPTTTKKVTTTSTRPPMAQAIKIGVKVKVANTGGAGLGIRTEPGINAAKRGAVRDNTVLDVIGGPRTADGLTWWQVRTGNLSGWAAEKYLVVTK